MVKDTLVIGQASVQGCCGTGPDDFSFYVQFVLELRLPLVAQVWRAYHSKAFDLTTFQKFLENDKGLNGFTYSHIIGNQQSNPILLQCHYQRYNLVGPGSKRQFTEAPERAGSIAKR